MQRAVIHGDVLLMHKAKVAYVNAYVAGHGSVTLTFSGKKYRTVPLIVKDGDVVVFDGYWQHNTYYVRTCRPQSNSYCGKACRQLIGRNVNVTA